LKRLNSGSTAKTGSMTDSILNGLLPSAVRVSKQETIGPLRGSSHKNN